MVNQVQTDTQQSESDRLVHYRWNWVYLIAFLILLTGLGMLSLLINKNKTMSAMKMAEKNRIAAAVSPVPSTAPMSGSIVLSSAAPQGKVGKNQQLILKAESEGKDITGFDILISYDPAEMSVVQVTPSNSKFQIVSYTKRKGQISITGTKTSGATSGVLNADQLVTISMNPLKAGKTSIELKSAINNETTKFIDSAYKQFTPRLESVQLDIL